MIPLSTTTIDVLRRLPADEYADPYAGEDTRREVVFGGVRAVIDRPSGREQVAGGEQAVTDFHLICDIVGVKYTDQVRDTASGTVYDVVWVITYPGEHVEAGLRLVEGEV